MVKLAIEYLPIKALKPYKNNTRKHQELDINNIVKSIENYGFDDPIGIWSDENIIVEGHGRLLAAKKLGMTEVPVIRLDHLTDQQRREYAIAHNATAELSQWDQEMLNLELPELNLGDFDFNLQFPDFDIDNGEVIEDEPPEPKIDEDPISKLGDIYQLGNHRLMVGDSTSENHVDQLMAGVDADLLLTDPPYNVNYVGKNTKKLKIQNDDMSDGVFKQFLLDAFAQAKRHLKLGGAFYVWYASRSGVAFENALSEQGLLPKQTLIWVKNNFTFGRQDYQWKHEPCFYGWKDGAAHYFVDDRTNTTVFEDTIHPRQMKKEELVALVEQILSDKVSTTVLHEDKPLRNDLHPTMKPVKLMARLIRNSTKPGEAVLDLFGGSGSTLIACEQTGRTCYMMEYDPKYADVIIQRWENLTGQKAVKINV